MPGDFTGLARHTSYSLSPVRSAYYESVLPALLATQTPVGMEIKTNRRRSIMSLHSDDSQNA